MVVRSFRLSDYGSLTELLEGALSASCFEDTREALARQLAWDSELVLEAVKDGVIVGVIIGTIDNNQGYYYRIAVKKEFRRRGIGKVLIQSLKRRFNQRKVSKIFVTVDDHNEPIVPLYESLGYGANDFWRKYKQLRIVSG